MIYLSSEIEIPIDLLDIENRVTKILNYLSLDKDLSILFVDDDRIQTINRDFRKTDSVTDVLSFSQNEGIFGDSTILGDVVICYPQAKRQAPLSNNTSYKEIIYLIIHSILHLIGFDHYTKEENTIMRKKEKEIFNFLFDL